MMTYYKARILPEALKVLEQRDVEGRALLRGTDLLVSLAEQLDDIPRVVVDLRGLEDGRDPLIVTCTTRRSGRRGHPRGVFHRLLCLSLADEVLRDAAGRIARVRPEDRVDPRCHPTSDGRDTAGASPPGRDRPAVSPFLASSSPRQFRGETAHAAESSTEAPRCERPEQMCGQDRARLTTVSGRPPNARGESQ